MSYQPKPTDEWPSDSDEGDTTEQVHIESYFPKGYDPDAEPWKSIREFHKKQLAAEREKVQTYEGALIKIANDPNCDRCQVAVDALAKVAK